MKLVAHLMEMSVQEEHIDDYVPVSEQNSNLIAHLERIQKAFSENPLLE